MQTFSKSGRSFECIASRWRLSGVLTAATGLWSRWRAGQKQNLPGKNHKENIGRPSSAWLQRLEGRKVLAAPPPVYQEAHLEQRLSQNIKCSIKTNVAF